MILKMIKIKEKNKLELVFFHYTNRKTNVIIEGVKFEIRGATT